MRNSRRKKGVFLFSAGLLSGIAVSAFAVSVFLFGWRMAEKRDSRNTESAQNTEAKVLTELRTIRKLREIQELIQNYYLDEIDSETLSAYLFKGVAAGLDDAYADYYSREELVSVTDSSRGSYTGIGAVLNQEDDDETGEITVYEIYPGTPADYAGLMAGDVLLEVDGEAITGLSLDDLVSRIKSMKRKFSIRFYRPETGEEMEVQLKIDTVIIPAVSYERMEDIGYIKLTEFTEIAVSQFVDAVEALEEQGIEQLIVDLRDNPGGLLTSVCEILNEVLPEGLLVYTEDRYGERKEYYSDSSRITDSTVAVLVNENSASASEIFAGAIQDYGIGPVIGRTTYGKGIVQKTYTLSDGSAFKMTVEKYYTPKGQDIHGNGITPDYVVEEELSGEEDSADTLQSDEDKEENVPDPILEKAIEILHSHEWEETISQDETLLEPVIPEEETPEEPTQEK